MYLSWKEQIIADFNESSIEKMYNDGFVFTRKGRGIMNQTRSLRVNLNKFELSSENRRVLNKTEDLNLLVSPIPYENYKWTIHKMGKEFYEKKFGEKTPALNRPAGSGLVFSAQKIKELITDERKSNFNKLLVYKKDSDAVGYCIAMETKNILHYCYPFYSLQPTTYNLQPTTYNLQPNAGMGMMLKAIVWAKENGKKYIYLGSFQRPTDTYKLQFSGLEWFDGKEWQNDLEELKKLV